MQIHEIKTKQNSSFHHAHVITTVKSLILYCQAVASWSGDAKFWAVEKFWSKSARLKTPILRKLRNKIRIPSTNN